MKQTNHIVNTEIQFEDGTSLEVRADCLSAKDVSDGYHTFKELYQQRSLLLSLWLSSQDAEQWSVHKSRLMPDGLPPFGSPNYFALSLTPPNEETVTVVLHLEDWDKFIVPITATLLRKGSYDLNNLLL